MNTGHFCPAGIDLCDCPHERGLEADLGDNYTREESVFTCKSTMVWSDCTLSPRFQSADCLKNQDVQKELLSLLRHVKQKKNGKMWEF